MRSLAALFLLSAIASAQGIAYLTSGFEQAITDAKRPVLVYLWMDG